MKRTPATSIVSQAPRSRRLHFEPLESRRMLTTAPWHNYAIPLDTNGSGTITATDALAVISELLRTGARQLLPDTPDPPPFFVDTNADGWLTPTDALLVVHRILSPPKVTLSTLVPFSIDVTPEVQITASSLATLADNTPVNVDVDLNNDGDFTDPGEANRSSGLLYQGAADFTLNPALPNSPPAGPYTVRLRAHVTDSDGFTGYSPVESLVVDTTTSSALTDYVHAADPSYHYSVAASSSGVGYNYYLLDMTSQTWRSAADVNKPVWREWVQVIVPTQVTSDTAMLFITGGSNDFTNQPGIDQNMLQIALGTHTVTVMLRGVPSEPLIFTDETRTRSEDEIIAYSFDKYLDNIGQPGNDTWPVLVAMVKSAVRAMDTAQTFVPTVQSNTQVNHFVVTGYSKRGWTTWLTAAADNRVVGIIPGVFDNLDQGPQMVHHYSVYGFFADDVQDYSDEHIFDRIMTPEGELLSKIVDPYRYLHNGNFNIPKLMLNSAGDEFFVPDSSQFYIHDLPGTQNYMRYFPNTGHGLDASAVTSTLTFYDAILNNRALPQYSWTVQPDGAIVVHSDTTPLSVTMWQATNPTARDFRHGYHPEIVYTSTALVDQGGQTYIADPDMPATGARAYFIELDYPSGIPGIPYQFTTEIHVKSTLPLTPWPFESGILTDDSLASPLASALASAPSAPADLNPVAVGLAIESLAAEQPAEEPIASAPAAATNQPAGSAASSTSPALWSWESPEVDDRAADETDDSTASEPQLAFN
jgi:PhoPQ-activated pathogenicity-related protein